MVNSPTNSEREQFTSIIAPISFPVGTNDLTQYTLVAGRDDATVSDYYDETYSSMLRLLGIIVREASGKLVTICGELAGREELIPTLVEIGFVRSASPLR
jgi:phosphoenolpyruvate-protein kinase (PTS system EI component)